MLYGPFAGGSRSRQGCHYNTEECVRSTLKAFSNALATTLSSVEGMDVGSILKLKISIDRECGDATFDFSGTSEQGLMNHSAPPALTYSATIYCLRCSMDHLPEGAGLGRAVISCLNQGCLAPIKFILPEVSPSVDAAVTGGYVLTSQRVVDLILKAFMKQLAAVLDRVLGSVKLVLRYISHMSCKGKVQNYFYIVITIKDGY